MDCDAKAVSMHKSKFLVVLTGCRSGGVVANKHTVSSVSSAEKIHTFPIDTVSTSAQKILPSRGKHGHRQRQAGQQSGRAFKIRQQMRSRIFTGASLGRSRLAIIGAYNMLLGSGRSGGVEERGSMNAERPPTSPPVVRLPFSARASICSHRRPPSPTPLTVAPPIRAEEIRGRREGRGVAAVRPCLEL